MDINRYLELKEDLEESIAKLGKSEEGDCEQNNTQIDALSILVFLVLAILLIFGMPLFLQLIW